MKTLTFEKIKRDLEVAAYVERLMPPVRPPRYRCCMPDIIYTQQEIAFMDRKLVRPRPTHAEVSIWEKVVINWLPLLTVFERNLVWKRANRLPWKLLCRELGRTRVHLWRIHDRAILKIQLQMKQKHKKCCQHKNT